MRSEEVPEDFFRSEACSDRSPTVSTSPKSRFKKIEDDRWDRNAIIAVGGGCRLCCNEIVMAPNVCFVCTKEAPSVEFVISRLTCMSSHRPGSAHLERLPAARSD